MRCETWCEVCERPVYSRQPSYTAPHTVGHSTPSYLPTPEWMGSVGRCMMSIPWGPSSYLHGRAGGEGQWTQLFHCIHSFTAHSLTYKAECHSPIRLVPGGDRGRRRGPVEVDPLLRGRGAEVVVPLDPGGVRLVRARPEREGIGRGGGQSGRGKRKTGEG
jgi:hypothetical protein